MLAFSLVAIEPVDMAPAKAGAPLCFGEPADIIGTSADDLLVGTNRAEVIVGLKGNDRIEGNGGRDRICAGLGNDYVTGWSGGDLARGGHGADKLIGGLAFDHLDGGPGGDEVSGGDGFKDSDTLVGGSGNDSLEGGVGQFDHDYLFGGSGNDNLHAGAGGGHPLDELFGGPGDDSLHGGGGFEGIAAFLFSRAPVTASLSTEGGATPGEATGEGTDTLTALDDIRGTRFSDVLSGNEEDNRLFGNDGDDEINGSAGTDYIDGGVGADVLDGGPDRDSVAFGSLSQGVEVSLIDGVAVADATDELFAFESVFSASYYDDVLTGDDARNRIHGGYGADAIFARAGDDWIDSGEEGDAGAGVDECYDSFEVANCEEHSHGDWPPRPHVISPRHASSLSPSEFTRVRGGVAGGAFQPYPRKIPVALRLFTPRGCLWWSGTEKALVVRSCGLPLWTLLDAPDEDDFHGRWTLPIDAPLPAGLYDVWTSGPSRRPQDLHNDICGGAEAPACVSFRLEN